MESRYFIYLRSRFFANDPSSLIVSRICGPYADAQDAMKELARCKAGNQWERIGTGELISITTGNGLVELILENRKPYQRSFESLYGEHTQCEQIVQEWREVYQRNRV